MPLLYSNFHELFLFLQFSVKGRPNSLILASLGFNFLFQNVENENLSKQFNLGRFVDRQRNKGAQLLNLGPWKKYMQIQIGGQLKEKSKGKKSKLVKSKENEPQTKRPGKWPVKMPLLPYLQVHNVQVLLFSHLMGGPTVQSGPCHV